MGREWVTGWRMVAAGFLGYVAGSTGLFFTFGLFLGPLGSEFHWSREALSAYLTLASFAYMIAAPVVGRLADHFGPRPVLIFCAAGTATVFALQGLLTPHLWHYYALAVVGGVLAPGTSALTFGKLVSNRFDRSRGIALSLLACATGLAALVLPPIAQALIARYGWREAYVLIGAGAFLIGVIPVALLVYGGPSPSLSTDAQILSSPARRAPSHLLAGNHLWILAVIAFAIGAIYVGILAHLIPILIDRGMSAADAAWVFSLLGVTAVIGHLVVGACFDRFIPSRVAAVVLALSAIGVVGIGLASSTTALVLCSVLMGISLGADIDLTPYLVSRYFGLGSYSLVLGVLCTAGTLGSSSSPFLMGRAFDFYHSYVLVTSLLAGIAALAAGLALNLTSTSAAPQ